MRLRKCERCIAALSLIWFVFGITFTIMLLMSASQDKQETIDAVMRYEKNSLLAVNTSQEAIRKESPKQSAGATEYVKVYAEEKNELYTSVAVPGERWPAPDYDIHAFYYIWYGNPTLNGKYLHWNHQYLPHWDGKMAVQWPTGFHIPPDDIGSNFYPELGLYSSANVSTIREHMIQLRTAGIGVISVSWYPPDQADGQGESTDYLIPRILDVANQYSIKVCLHIEPYKGRSASSLSTMLQYIFHNYGNHAAFYRRKHRGRELPLFYIYDSYNVKKQEWARLFKPDGDLSIRNTKLDGIYIGLLVEQKHQEELISSGFDGYYTYFASDGFTHGSKGQNWKELSQQAVANDVFFIPSVGPGYIDDRIRPWNKINTQLRKDGNYYELKFRLAIEAAPRIISITSFNEWHEGTQIEKAVPKKTKFYKYEDYLPNQSDFYLLLTRKWIHKFKRHKG